MEHHIELANEPFHLCGVQTMVTGAEGQRISGRSMASGAVESVSTQDPLRRLPIRFDHFGDH
jgi:hypothetical protein